VTQIPTQTFDVLLGCELVGRQDDLVALTRSHIVVERHFERQVPFSTPRLEVPVDVEVEGEHRVRGIIAADPPLEVPAFTRTVFLLNHRDGDGDGTTRTFELELDRPTGIFVPIEEGEHQVELARATRYVERQLVLSHTTLL